MRHGITVISGPAGVGKGTVVQLLRASHPEVWVSVSATTRPPRPGEVDGVHYLFTSDAEFDRLIETDGLLEWAVVHGRHRYGTPAGPVLEAAAQGRPVILEIDLQGARQVRETLPEAHFVFLAPPDWSTLVSRLEGRGTESPDQVARRLETARIELAAAEEFDEVIVNDELGRTVAQLVDSLGLQPQT
ncbi:guanylate kinase [Propioniciclava sp. MC1595]|uniref:guanylate kinase n=1 Tax=Propioniciclava sp. MC1595 TaxID=2760308 RepID=UPI00166258CA|nr:guanylate kinase [Propioniciclava sp. MC1595]MBB1495981.1 guanylate kinase [Propioniciclava sp. MC1595]